MNGDVKEADGLSGDFELSARLSLLVQHLDLALATGDPYARWERHQLQFLQRDDMLTHDTKSRQIGWSWTAAANAVGTSTLNPRHTSIFVSLNLDEAQEKIRYAYQIIDALDSTVRPRLVLQNRFEIEFENGSRILSHPCTPVRGKAKADIYLDEMAHYVHDKEVYTSVVPVLTRGGSLRIGSTPLGASGMFWEIGQEELRPYRGYVRRRLPWWSSDGLCKDVASATKCAAQLSTPERVYQYGTTRLTEIYENMLEEDFQQEYELSSQPEAESWINWDVIKANQTLDADGRLWHRHVTARGDHPGDLDTVFKSIEEVRRAVMSGEVEGAVYAGFDVGRKRDLSELTFVGKGASDLLPYRLAISLEGVRFEDQFEIAARCLGELPVAQLLIDRNGLGMHIAEKLEDQFGAQAHGVEFTNPNKELWAVKLKVAMEMEHVPIPLDRELGYQLASVKKEYSLAKHAVFDTERNERHHADKFWSLALATWAARSAQEERRPMRAMII